MLQEYYDFLQAYTHPGPDLSAYIGELPQSLGDDMNMELYAEFLWKVDLFKGVLPSFYQRLGREMQMRVYLAGIFHALALLSCAVVATPRYTFCSRTLEQSVSGHAMGASTAHCH